MIAEPSALTLQMPNSFQARFRVNVKVYHEVLSIDRAQKQVVVKNLETGETFLQPYDKLLLATGAKPILPPIPDAQKEKIFTLRTVEDTFKIYDFVTRVHPQTAEIVGGGFIGVEVAENLCARGLAVTLIQGHSHVLTPFDADMAAFIHAELRKQGICLRLNERADVANLEADLIILALGVKPDTALAQAAGLQLGLKESIRVSPRMETSDPAIYAVGDAVQVTDFVSGRETLIALAGPANKQARIAADNICGRDSRYVGGQGSSIIKVFDLTAATTGINERTAQDLGLAYEKVVLSPMSHAGYYPGGQLLTMKVLFEKDSYRLLGAQIVGYDGVDKRIDVLATALRAGMTAPALAELDLAYAPPYLSAKDPVNMAGFIAENIQTGLVKQWYYDQADSLPRDGSVTLLDTRTAGEFNRGHIDGFINIPVDALRARLAEVPHGKPVYVICQSGLRSYIAGRILAGHGYEVYNFAGGYRYYATIRHDQSLVRTTHPCGKE